MSAKDEHRELIPVIIATLVAGIGAFCLWSDLKSDSQDRGDGMTTSAIVLRAGATMTPSAGPCGNYRWSLSFYLNIFGVSR
jgi:hypothetical protein